MTNDPRSGGPRDVPLRGRAGAGPGVVRVPAGAPVDVARGAAGEADCGVGEAARGAWALAVARPGRSVSSRLPGLRRRPRRDGAGLGLVGVLVVLAVVVTACGTSGDGGAGSGAAPDGSAVPTPEPTATPAPQPTTSPAEPSVEPTTRGDVLRVTGTVRRSPEDRLVVLEAPAQAGRQATTWVLVGAVGAVQDGDRVTVLGRPDPDALTTAQRGPVLVVESVDR